MSLQFLFMCITNIRPISLKSCCLLSIRCYGGLVEQDMKGSHENNVSNVTTAKMTIQYGGCADFYSWCIYVQGGATSPRVKTGASTILKEFEVKRFSCPVLLAIFDNFLC